MSHVERISDLRDSLRHIDFDVSAADSVDQITALEDLKAACAAAQARATMNLSIKRRHEHRELGVPEKRVGSGLASEVGLARRVSPHRGGRYLGFARAVVDEMPHTMAALESGRLSEWRATILVRETAYLDVEDRAAIDAELCADSTTLDGVGDRALTARAKALAYQRDPHAVVARAGKAAEDRRVTSRPAPDSMATVSARLPVAQGTAAGRDARLAVRRLFTKPAPGALVAMESAARAFPKAPALLIRLRDQVCRTPFCDGPVRHVDHVKPHAEGGSTNADNGQGLCEQSNYAKQAPGWRSAIHPTHSRIESQLSELMAA